MEEFRNYTDSNKKQMSHEEMILPPGELPAQRQITNGEQAEVPVNERRIGYNDFMATDTAEEKPSGAKHTAFTVVYVFSMLFFAFMTVFMGVMAFETLRLMPIFITLIFATYAIGCFKRLKSGKDNSSLVKTIGASVVLLFVCAYMDTLTLPFISITKSKYSHVRDYETKRYDLDKDFLPETIPEDSTSYKFTGMPSILQGSGYISLRFKNTTKEIQKIADDYSFSVLDGTIKLSQYESPDIGAELDKKTISIRYDRDFWEGHEDKAYVCVLDSHGTGNHPHSTVVIIDTEDGMIEFSKLGR